MPTTYFTHDPESIFQAGFYIPETTAYGTPDTGADATQFSAMTLTCNVNMNRTAVEVAGATLPVGMVQGLETSSWKAEGPLCWEDIRFLSGILPTITSTSVTGGVVSDAPSNPNSYTLQLKDLIAHGCAVSGINLKGNTKNITASINFLGQAISHGNTEETVGVADPVMFIPFKTTVTFGSVQSKVNEWELDIQDIWGQTEYLGANKTPSQAIAQGRCSESFNCTLPYDKAVNAGIYDGISVKNCKIENESVIGSYKYTFAFEFKAIIESVGNAGDTNNVYTIPVNCVIKNDSPKAISLTSAKTSISSGE